MLALQGKVALVTGGSRGIGAGIAERLAADGADVAITYNTAAHRADGVVAKIKDTGRRGLALAAPATDPAAVTEAVEQTVAELGQLDILINNAGIFTYGPIDELTLEQFEETLAVHVRAVFVAVQAAVKHLPESGRIISIGSNLAERVPGPGLSLYALSKSALVGFTKGLARDLGPRGITANVVHPGSTDTDMNPADGEIADAERARTALGRYGTTADVAGMVAYLASEAGRNITGTSITVDGGANA
ncbi:SDR family NAD(P)-dependent oxidoreductase [Actinopolymorpha alba]|uniref:SDR family NAD(P)-dependent oxidoreductase n=1 Tax=Actinopolymorpha alba TaxID=533267 RepID=UPI00035F8D11|nr:SDR family oxidoreductase [Actinopolymorpha alba]